MKKGIDEGFVMSTGNKTLKDLSIKEIQQFLWESSEEEAFSIIADLENDKRKGVINLITKYRKEIEQREKENARLSALYQKEKELQQRGYNYIAGIDEAGRGPLAGPVVAACVILKPDTYLPGLNDSKKISNEKRNMLAEMITKEAISIGIGLVNHEEIDRVNILQATIKAMVQAVAQMKFKPDYLLIDALKLPVDIPQEGIIEGDAKCAAISAASIIAKTYRDTLMSEMDELYPEYGFKDHKGYGTLRHMEAINIFGPCTIHRKSFLHLT